MADLREVVEGTQYQGEDEEIVYTLTTTNFGSAPSAVAVVVKDVTNADTVVTSTVTSGSPSVFGDVITMPKIQDLTAGHVYRVDVKFTSGSNVFEPYFLIEASA